VTARQAFVVTLVVLATLTAAYMLYWLAGVVMLLFGAIIFASAIRPFVAALDGRGLHRGLAILLLYLVILLVVLGLLIVSVPPLLNFLMAVFADGILTDHLRQLAVRVAQMGWGNYQMLIPVIRLPAQFEAYMAQTGDEVQREAWTITQNTLFGLGQALLLFTMAFYWLTARERTLALLLLLSPKRHRNEVNAIWTDVENRLGAYVRGQVLLMLIIGVFACLGLLLLRVPYAIALGLIAGLTEAIPYVGPLLGAVPAVVVGFTVSPWIGLAVALYYLLLQAAENYVLEPRIMSSNVGLSPLVIIIAIVAGGMINGVAGAVLAIPLAGALQVIVQHRWIDPALSSLSPAQKESAVKGTDEDGEEELGLPEPEALLEEDAYPARAALAGQRESQTDERVSLPTRQ
jgi:predicted PurR-regulated permease PerM